MELCLGAIERKVIDTSGRLGSLDDASCDLAFDNAYVKSLENPQFYQDVTYQVLQGSQSNGVVNLLKRITFDDSLLQSILLGIAKTSGIISLINSNEYINENTRFLDYSFRCREDKLSLTDGKTNKTVSLPLRFKS